MFALQDEISASHRRALRLEAFDGSSRDAALRAEPSCVYEAYLKAREHSV